MKTSQLGNAIRRGSKWLLAGNVGSQILQFISGIVLARLLVPSDFGMLVTVQIFTGIAGFLAGGGMGQALVRAKVANELHFNVVFTLQIIIGVLIYCFFFLIAPYFSQWFNHELYEDLLRVSAITFLLRPFANIPTSILSRKLDFKFLAIVNITKLIFASILSITMAYFGFEVWSLVFGGLLGSILSIALLLAFTRWRPKFVFRKEIANEFGKYGIKYSVNDVLGHIYKQIANFMISRSLGPSMVGLFNKADSLNQIPRSTINSAIYQPVLRGLAQEQENIDKSKYIFFRTIMLVSVYTMPFYVLLWWIAEPFITFVYGPNWTPAAEPLQILALTGLLLIGNPSGAVIAAQNKLGREIFINIEAIILLFLGCYIGLDYQLKGIAYAILITHIYSSFRIFSLANSALGSKYKQLLLALIPAYTLCGILFFTLLLIDYLLIFQIHQIHPALYLSVMSIIGGTVYILSFLFIPIKSLEPEVNRWKSVLIKSNA